MKLSILYVSKTGNTKQVAEYIRKGMLQYMPEAEVRLFDVEKTAEMDCNYITESSAVVFGTPTYCAAMAWQLKKWFDDFWNVDLSNKIGAVFATANVASGGVDTAIMSVVPHLMVKGMLVYSGGVSEGAPFIHLGVVAFRGKIEESQDIATIYGYRIARKADTIIERAHPTAEKFQWNKNK